MTDHVSWRGVWSSLLLLLAACSSSPSRQAAPPVSAAQPAPVVDDGRCRKGTPPSGDETRANIDVDGDGDPEVVRMRRHGPCDDLASWRVSVDGLERDLSESFGYVGPTPPYLLGGIDLDGDGGQEIWAHTGLGRDVRPIRLVQPPLRCARLCEVRERPTGRVVDHRRPQVPAGRRLPARRRGRIDRDLVCGQLEHAGGPTAVVSVRTYHLDGSVLRLDSQVSVPDDTASAAYWQLRCGPLTTMRPYARPGTSPGTGGPFGAAWPSVTVTPVIPSQGG